MVVDKNNDVEELAEKKIQLHGVETSLKNNEPNISEETDEKIDLNKRKVLIELCLTEKLFCVLMQFNEFYQLSREMDLKSKKLAARLDNDNKEEIKYQNLKSMLMEISKYLNHCLATEELLPLLFENIEGGKKDLIDKMTKKLRSANEIKRFFELIEDHIKRVFGDIVLTELDPLLCGIARWELAAKQKGKKIDADIADLKKQIGDLGKIINIKIADIILEETRYNEEEHEITGYKKRDDLPKRIIVAVQLWGYAQNNKEVFFKNLERNAKVVISE